MSAYLLSDPMLRRLWTIAQRKYGWGYYGSRDYSSFEALQRRGLVELIDSTITHRSYKLTEAGMEECRRRFPISPAVLGTYEPQPGGWTPREGVAACMSLRDILMTNTTTNAANPREDFERAAEAFKSTPKNDETAP